MGTSGSSLSPPVCERAVRGGVGNRARPFTPDSARHPPRAAGCGAAVTLLAAPPVMLQRGSDALAGEGSSGMRQPPTCLAGGCRSWNSPTAAPPACRGLLRSFYAGRAGQVGAYVTTSSDLRPSAFQVGHTPKSPCNVRASGAVAGRLCSRLVVAVAVTVAVKNSCAGSSAPRSGQSALARSAVMRWSQRSGSGSSCRLRCSSGKIAVRSVSP